MRRARGPVLALAALLAAAAPGRGRAGDGFSASAEEGYSHAETDARDQAGRDRREQVDLFTQRYRGALTRNLTDALAATVGGTLLDERSWAVEDGVHSGGHARTDTLFARLNLGTPVLNAGVGADRREQQELGASAAAILVESYSAFATWRPLGLPELDLRLSHVDTHDRARRDQDTTRDAAQLSTRYRTERFDVRYLLGWGRAEDRLAQVQTTTVEQSAMATRTDVLFGGRFSSYLSGSLATRNATTTRFSEDARITRQQITSAGLSAVVIFPALSENVTLAPNPALVDGNTAQGAAVNLGFGPSTLGDRNPREVGGGFVDEVTPVNWIHVWLDKAPTGAVGTALAATVQVYASADNRTWTPVQGAGTPQAAPFDNRLEIPIQQTAARYLKVKLLPLAAGVTGDAAYRDLAVTEVQFLLVQSASQVPRTQRNVALSGTALTRTLLLRAPDLAHDLSATITRQSEAGLTTYSVVNGLGVNHELTRGLAGTARVAREDTDGGNGHEGAYEWAAGLAGRPLPTAYWSLTYSGRDSDRLGTLNALAALGRADWYEGVSMQASATGSVRRQGETAAQALETTGTTTLTPNRWVTASFGGLYSRTWKHTPDLGLIWTQFLRADAGLSLTPAPALSAAGTVSRVLIGDRPTTLATLQLNFSPVRGELQLSASYSKTLDTQADSTTEVVSPTLRWAIRQRVTLTTTYTQLKTSSPVQTLESRIVAANLLVSL